MIRLVLLPIVLASTACNPGIPGETRNEHVFVLPGGFSEQTSVADLEARFGKANVTVVDRRDDGSATRRSIVLFADDPSRRAYVDFHDDETLTGLASISVRDAGSRWRGKGGVHIGMSFAELVRANGKPFGISGFDSQQRGWVQDQWSPARDGDDGQLGALDVSEGERMYFGVELGLRGKIASLPVGTWPVDDSISSNDPRYPQLGELVEVTAINATTSLDDEWQ